MSFVFAGLPIGYGRVKTLTDASTRNSKGDIAEFRPVGCDCRQWAEIESQSIMVGVPAVWELIRKGILGRVEASGALKKNIFHFALGAKQFAQSHYVPLLGGLTDAVVFNQVS